MSERIEAWMIIYDNIHPETGECTQIVETEEVHDPGYVEWLKQHQYVRNVRCIRLVPEKTEEAEAPVMRDAALEVLRLEQEARDRDFLAAEELRKRLEDGER